MFIGLPDLNCTRPRRWSHIINNVTLIKISLLTVIGINPEGVALL
jgi:hypothetical protein